MSKVWDLYMYIGPEQVSDTLKLMIKSREQLPHKH
jgi:hypothetical protein